jgi:glycosyltransferase involved in cell wall biosynthesis
MTAPTRSQILYITYDGLLDPLGASQIVPYLKGITAAQGSLVILSFEKPERGTTGMTRMAEELAAFGIRWKSLRFTAGLGAPGKVWDLSRMYFWGARLAIQNGAKIVHTRGHPTAQVGFFIKRLFGAKLIFDFRGLWVDERVDKGGWDLRRPLHRLQYRHFKNTERKLLARADQVVVLTHAVVDEVIKLGASPPSKITVIPCCADFEYFPLATAQRRAKARESIGIPADALVLGYLGSVGRMYMLDRYFRLFELGAAKRRDVHALVITQDVDALRKVLGNSLPGALHSRVHVKPATRDEAPEVIAAMDVLVSFIQPSYARMAASPTKLAECFAEGIPAICNAGVGDVAEQIDQLGAGIILDPASDDDLSRAADRLGEIRAMGGLRLRNEAQQILGLEVAVARYRSVYSKLG